MVTAGSSLVISGGYTLAQGWDREDALVTDPGDLFAVLDDVQTIDTRM